MSNKFLSARHISDLVDEAKAAKADLDTLNIRLEEVTRAVALAADVWLVVTNNPNNPAQLMAAELLYDTIVVQAQEIQKRRDAIAWVIESLRQRDIYDVNAALDDLVIGGIRFG